MDKRFPISWALGAVRRSNRDFVKPSVERVTPRGDAFRVLIATILSLRTKDETTLAAARRLFEVAATPEDVLRLTAGRIERLIFPVGFYRVKARTLREVSRTILERFAGRVPDSIDDLLTLKGVGRKTANLVLTHGHDRPGICVDVHVHRITNRWGYLRTRNPEDTEMRLREVLPARHWKEFNGLLVTFGQSICRPVSPWCSRCPLAEHCPRKGVGRAR
jgi:endonuclease-3